MNDKNDQKSEDFINNIKSNDQEDQWIATLLPDLLVRLNLNQPMNVPLSNQCDQHIDLGRVLQHSDWVVRAQAILQIGKQDPDVRQAYLKHLEQALDDKHPSVRVAALSVLGLCYDPPVHDIQNKLTDPDWHVREIAAQTLGMIGDERARLALKRVQQDSDIYVRQAAVQALSLLTKGYQKEHQPGQTRAKIVVKTGRKGLRRPWLMALAAAVLIVIVLLPDTQALANYIVSSFRVLYFHAVPTHNDPESLQTFPQLQDIGELHVRGFENQQQLTVEQAGKLISFPLRQPSFLPKGVEVTPICTVTNKGQTTFTFRASQARHYLDAHNAADVVIPAKLDGATFTINVDASVLLSYKDQSQNDYLQIIETPAPVIQATGQASLNDLRDFLVKIPSKWSKDLIKQLSNIDLNSGVLPVILNAQTTVEEKKIHGATGIFLHNTIAQNTVNQLFWQEQGIIYTINSQREDGNELALIASSLH